MVMDCTKLAIDQQTRKLLQMNPVYGGNAGAVWVSKTYEQQVVTLKPKILPLVFLEHYNIWQDVQA